MTTPIKKLLTGLVMGGFLFSVGLATSVREFQAMTHDQKLNFLMNGKSILLTKVKAYDPALEQKTRYYMLDETNAVGGSMGLGAVLDVVSVSVLKRLRQWTMLKWKPLSRWSSAAIGNPKASRLPPR